MTLTPQAKLMLLMGRCGYTNLPLTAKGRGWIPAVVWRKYVKIRGRFDTEFRREVVEYLKQLIPPCQQ